MSLKSFKKLKPWEPSVDEQVAEAKAGAAVLFDTEKVEITNFRVGNLQRLKTLQEIARLPEPHEHHRYVTHNAFNAFTWIDLFCACFPIFEEAYITSYNFGEAPIQILFEKFDAGQFQRLSLIISESIRFRMPARFFQMRDGVVSRKNPGLRMAGIWNHSKIILLKPAGREDYFIVEGSGNFSENAYIEQYSVDNSEEIYRFHRDWMERYVFDPASIGLKRHFVVTGDGVLTCAGGGELNGKQANGQGGQKAE